jgi:hypothetical protein
LFQVEQRDCLQIRESEGRERPSSVRAAKLSRVWGHPMRIIDVVLAAVLLGLIVGFLNMPRSEARAEKVVSERITWLWTPALPSRSPTY